MYLRHLERRLNWLATRRAIIDDPIKRVRVAFVILHGRSLEFIVHFDLIELIELPETATQ
jgi:hypothetical protein